MKRTFGGKKLVERKVFTKKQAKKIGKKLGVDWSKFDVEQFRIGMDIELEHGKIDSQTNVTNDNPLTTGKIALAHLKEFPDYYDRLTEMEDDTPQKRFIEINEGK